MIFMKKNTKKNKIARFILFLYLCRNFYVMKFRSILVLFFMSAIITLGRAQKKEYMVKTVAFYNVENLFDTINDPKKFDDDRTPTGKDKWTSKEYNDHIDKIASVIARIGKDVTGKSPNFVGLAEVENKDVLVDLINNKHLKKENYSIVHFDSPDARGIDVAFLYKKENFILKNASKYPLKIYDSDGKRRYTRDQLLVSGVLENEEIHFIVNHWPSRSGGEAASRPFREEAAKLNKKIIDSLQEINPKAKVISMGDFNDDATNSSFKKILKTRGEKHKVKEKELFNPMEGMLKKGVGSLAYHDNWNLFDQIFFTHELLYSTKGYKFWKAQVFNDALLVQSSGKYTGYPFRSYSNGEYTGGYSDHFPVYIFLIKEVENQNDKK